MRARLGANARSAVLPLTPAAMTLKLVLIYKELLEASIAHKLAARAARAKRAPAGASAKRRRCTATTASTPRRCRAAPDVDPVRCPDSAEAI